MDWYSDVSTNGASRIQIPTIQLKITFKKRTQIVVECDGSHRGILSNSNLEKKTRNSNEEEHQEIGNEKSTPSMLETEVGKSPHVAKA